eukprot:TRINITY_DN1519_c0_g1_i5.p1 TRINITY_DN1519_c0_g1~~TRINITY_DN1519_c0_g1_i5.p1  ORF type:complete len:227 (-),score=30.79 TRINITY_DN1519_c0_g1_i5:456-1097(-)
MTWRGFAALDTQRCWTVTATQHVDHVDQVFYHYSFQQLAEPMEQWLDTPVAVHVQLEETQAAAVWDKDKLEALLGCLYVQHPLFVTEHLLKNYPLWGYGPACELPSATKLGWADMLDAAHLAPVVIKRAADGLGLFALEEIGSGALIGEYTGMIQTEGGRHAHQRTPLWQCHTLREPQFHEDQCHVHQGHTPRHGARGLRGCTTDPCQQSNIG